MEPYTVEKSNALKSIAQVWRASFNTSRRYNSATDRFKDCRDLVVSSPSYAGSEIAFSVEPSEFFNYLKSIKKSRSQFEKPRHANDVDPNGDFDDMGMYEYEQSHRYRAERKGV